MNIMKCKTTGWCRERRTAEARADFDFFVVEWRNVYICTSVCMCTTLIFPFHCMACADQKETPLLKARALCYIYDEFKGEMENGNFHFCQHSNVNHKKNLLTHSSPLQKLRVGQ
jgi:hypothetical protein